MKTLKLTVAKVWNAVVNALGLLIGLIFPLLSSLGIVLCFLAALMFGADLWLAPSHIMNWITTGVMWGALGFAIRLLFLCTKDMLHDIKNNDHIGTDFAKNLQIKL